MSLRFSLLPEFESGERILSSLPWAWMATGKSLPTYRVFAAIPIIAELGLYVTDRRLVFVASLFRILGIHSSIWFLDDQSRERLDHVTTGRSSIFGPYVEIVSEDPHGHWWRSRVARIRIYTRNADELQNTIHLQATGNDSQPSAGPNVLPSVGQP